MQYYSKMHIPTTIIWLLSKGQNKTKTRKKTKKSIGIIMYWGRRKTEGKTEEKKKIKRLDHQQKNDKTRLRSNSTD